MISQYSFKTLSRNSLYEVNLVTTATTKSYIVMEVQKTSAPFNWFYLGTRKVPFGMRAKDAISLARRLTEERRMKHDLASRVRASKAMLPIVQRYIKSGLIKKHFLTRFWGTGAVIVIPRSKYISDILEDESHSCFIHTAKDWVHGMKSFAENVRKRGYHMKLTPDFDGNKPKLRELFRKNLQDYSAGIISCGKSSYTITSLMACAYATGLSDVDKKERIAIVGCGNLGKGVLRKLKRRGYSNLVVCDLKDNVLCNTKAGKKIQFIQASHGIVAGAILARARFVFITLRDRYAVSNTNSECFRDIPTIIVGSNQAISTDKKGYDFVKSLRDLGVNIVLGPVATLGGPMTATAEAEIRRNSLTVDSNGHLTRKGKNMIHKINKKAGTIITEAYLHHIHLGEHPVDVIERIRNGSIALGTD